MIPSWSILTALYGTFCTLYGTAVWSAGSMLVDYATFSPSLSTNEAKTGLVTKSSSSKTSISTYWTILSKSLLYCS